MATAIKMSWHEETMTDRQKSKMCDRFENILMDSYKQPNM